MRLNKTQTPSCGERSLDNEVSPQNTLSGEKENGAEGRVNKTQRFKEGS